MGDFDRNQAPKQNDQSKKIMIVVALGVVLIGVAGYPMMKHGPQVASAAPSGGDASIVIPESNPDETPEQASNALKIDPTASLLVHSSRGDQEFSKTPHNPFVMSTPWRSSLIRPVRHPNMPQQAYTPTAIPVHIPLTVKLDAYKLNSIVRQQDRFIAIINGNIVNAGMIIDGARVLEIREDRVTLQNAEDRDGTVVELTLVPKLR